MAINPDAGGTVPRQTGSGRPATSIARPGTRPGSIRPRPLVHGSSDQPGAGPSSGARSSMPDVARTTTMLRGPSGDRSGSAGFDRNCASLCAKAILSSGIAGIVFDRVELRTVRRQGQQRKVAGDVESGGTVPSRAVRTTTACAPGATLREISARWAFIAACCRSAEPPAAAPRAGQIAPNRYAH